MPHVTWTDRQRAGEASIAGMNREAGHRVHGARECVDALFYLIDLDAEVMPEPLEPTIIGHSWEVVEATHARWALVTAITAVDLCAAAIGRLFCNISGDAHDLSVRSTQMTSNRRRRERLKHIPEGPAGWLRSVHDDPTFRLLKDMRDRLTHQIHERAQYYVSDFSGGFDLRSLKPMERMMLEVPMSKLGIERFGTGAAAQFSIPDVIAKAAEFAHFRVGHFLDGFGSEGEAQ
jgi:hypothetical protein